MESARANAHEDKAIYHYEYRKELLAQAATAVGATYGNTHRSCHHLCLTLRRTDHEPTCGSTPLDVTAVHPNQLLWGRDIKHRPVELLLFNPPTASDLSKTAVETLKYGGKLLLDFREKPVRDFPSLPLVISSKVEGWRVEAWMRSDSRMKMTDIVARIPVKWAINDAGNQAPVPIYNSGSVRERARIFRNDAGLITWKPGGSDPKIEKFMDELRSPNERLNNQAIGRDLTDLEKASMAKLNVGTRPDRAKDGQDPRLTQRYKDRVNRKIDLTYDFDCRAENPETPEEVQAIQDALKQTYMDFAFYTNEPLELPNPQDCYLEQWNSMQVQLQKIWAKDRTKKTEPPQLFALGKWNLSFDNWVSAPRAYLTCLRK